MPMPPSPNPLGAPSPLVNFEGTQRFESTWESGLDLPAAALQSTTSTAKPSRSRKSPSPSLYGCPVPQMYDTSKHRNTCRSATSMSPSGGKMLGPVSLPAIQHPIALRRAGIQRIARRSTSEAAILYDGYDREKRRQQAQGRRGLRSRQHKAMQRIAKQTMTVPLVGQEYDVKLIDEQKASDDLYLQSTCGPTIHLRAVHISNPSDVTAQGASNYDREIW